MGRILAHDARVDRVWYFPRTEEAMDSQTLVGSMDPILLICNHTRGKPHQFECHRLLLRRNQITEDLQLIQCGLDSRNQIIISPLSQATPPPSQIKSCFHLASSATGQLSGDWLCPQHLALFPCKLTRTVHCGIVWQMLIHTTAHTTP